MNTATLATQCPGCVASCLVGDRSHELYAWAHFPSITTRRRSRQIYRAGCRLGGGIHFQSALTETLTFSPCWGGGRLRNYRWWPPRTVAPSHHRQTAENGLLGWIHSIGGRRPVPLKQCSRSGHSGKRCASNGPSPFKTHYSWDAHASRLSCSGFPPDHRSPSGAPRRTRFVRKADFEPPPRPVHGHRQTPLLWVDVRSPLANSSKTVGAAHRRQFVLRHRHRPPALIRFLNLIRGLWHPQPDVPHYQPGNRDPLLSQLFGDTPGATTSTTSGRPRCCGAAFLGGAFPA